MTEHPAFSLWDLIERLMEAQDDRATVDNWKDRPQKRSRQTRERRRWPKYARYQRIRCVNCDAPTSKPLSERPPCVCGSRCWYEGERPRPIWRAVTNPVFLAISTEDLALIEQQGGL